MKMKKITFQGWKNCIELTNGDFRIVVTTEIGPRIVGAFLGKPICSDFQEAKPTMLYLEAIHRLPAERRPEFDRFLRLPHYSESDIAAIRALLTDCGAAGAVRDSIAALSDCAKKSLLPLPDNRWRGMLATLVEQMLIRSV